MIPTQPSSRPIGDEQVAAPNPSTARGAPRRRSGGQGRSAWLELVKPGIAGFVAVTSGVSYFVASGGTDSGPRLIHTMLATLIATAGALALNQYLERDYDAKMERTRIRPIPTGRIEPRRALLFAIALMVGGTLYMATAAGPVPAGVVVFSALAYNGTYTPLKTRTPISTLVGAVPGALPTVIGWSAWDPGLSPGLLPLFGILFFWQLVHVLALGWNLRSDYAKAGFLLIPRDDEGGSKISGYMVLSAALLIPVSVAPTVMGLTGFFYAAGATLLGCALLAGSIGFVLNRTRQASMRVFLTSLAYHPAIMALLVLDVR